MRWFKHMTRSWDDEKISSLVEKYGIEGYGFYFRVLEIVAANLEDSSHSAVTYSLRKWSKLTAIFQPKVLRLCQVCGELGLIEYELSANLLKVSIPKIFKYRDEYSEKREKKNHKNRDNIPTVSEKCPRRTDTDTDTETDLDTDTDPSKKIEDTPLNLSPSKGKISADKKQIVEFQKAMGAFSLTEVEKMNVTLLIDAGCKPEDVLTAKSKSPEYVKSFKSEFAMRQINSARQIRVGEIKAPEAPFDVMAWLAKPEPEESN
ncbi:MAG TPA: hypothetical protein PKC25_07675 [Candidatus Rifleibacterium sp.]|nr:hypothetical protein [Candidatus Rifleibacterium sp.]